METNNPNDNQKVKELLLTHFDTDPNIIFIQLDKNGMIRGGIIRNSLPCNDLLIKYSEHITTILKDFGNTMKNNKEKLPENPIFNMTFLGKDEKDETKKI